MGVERAELVVALQSTLMRAVGEFAEDANFGPLRDRLLATAAALDYVLMLTTGTAGTRIIERDAARAVREGMVRAIDDAIAGTTAIAELSTPKARSFTREAVRLLHDALRSEDLATENRRFALIALSNP